MVIFLTGATGFVGSHVARELHRQGHALILGKRSTSNTWRIADLMEHVSCVDVDLISYDDFFSELPVDCIIHCATTYSRNESNMELPLEANVLFPLRLLLNGAAHGVRYFLNTDSFFTKPELMDEISPYMGGYSFSKKFFLQYGRFCSQKCGVKFINLRLEHVYGDQDGEGKFIPRILSLCKNNAAAIPLSPGTQERDFIHVSDVASAYSAIVAHLPDITEDFTEYQVGTGYAKPLRSFVELIKEATESTTTLQWGRIGMNPGEIMCSCADNSSLLQLGWKPKICDNNTIKNTLKIAAFDF